MPNRADVAEVYRAPDGFRYRLRAGNGEIVAAGEAYHNHADLVAMLAKHFPHADIFDLDAAQVEEIDPER